ncbi:MAG TPA: hypothetical protein DCG37_09005 [Lachnospiraceae bacterium]|nr:hypothetical protein [Lachnospiraceae bacterium]
MKGKKLITWLLSAALLAGSVMPVYGSDTDTLTENTVGIALENEMDEGDNLEILTGDESISDIAESESAAEALEEDAAEEMSDESELTEVEDLTDDSTDAVPETVEEVIPDESVGDLIPDDSSAGQTDSLTDSSTSGKKGLQETVVGSTYTSAVPEDGKTYYIRSAANRNFALTVHGNSINNQANINLYQLTKTLDQKFMCRKFTDGSVTFANFHSGKVLRIEGNEPKNSANIWQFEFNSARCAKWKLIKNNDGSYRIASAMNTNYVIDIYAGSLANNQNIQLYKWNNTAAQKFIFTETPIPSYAGTMQLRPSHATKMCAAPAGNSARSGVAIKLEAAENSKILTYTAVQYAAGYYVLVNRSNGLVLSVKNSENKSGAAIIQETRNNKFCQQWLIRKNSNGTYSFLSRLNSTLAIAVYQGLKAAGTKFILSTYKDYSSEKFYTTIYNGTAIPTGEVYIRSVLNSDRVMDAAGAGTADGTNIDCYDWNATKAQKFKLVAVTFGGKTNYWFKIVSVLSGKVLETAGGAAHAGTNIQLGTYRGAKSQLWRPVLMSDGSYIIKSALNQNMAIDMTGSEAYGANIQLSTYANNAQQKWYFTSVTITKNYIDFDDHKTITVLASGTKQYSDTERAYLFAISPYGRTLKGYTPIASAPMGTSYTFHANLNKNAAGSLLMRKFYIATLSHGTYTVISNGFYIQNPQAAATNVKAFPKASRGTKKGIKTGADSINLAKDLKCSHVVLDLPIDTFLSGSEIAYKYEGTTYHFSHIIDVYRDRILAYNRAGIIVTGIFYLYDSSNTRYMYPAAASGSRRGAATLYALNTRTSDRKRLEALFACLTDHWCTSGCTLANWIYGNELQQYNVYHYAGDIPYSEYHEVLAEEFRMFNAAIKSRWKNARTYISLDHNWNLSWTLSGSYSGMKLTSDFNTDLRRQGLIHWDMAMHPYPSPEQDCRIWNRAFTVENSGAAQQITMLNARYFAAYIKNTYGTSTRIIMSETGLSSVYEGRQMQGEQAAAVAFAYYLAEFDPNIDQLAIHRDYDNSGETSGGWWLGIYNSNGSPKPSADVFKYMDTKNWNAHVAHYMNTYIGSDWKSKIHGFNASFFNNK